MRVSIQTERNGMVMTIPRKRVSFFKWEAGRPKSVQQNKKNRPHTMVMTVHMPPTGVKHVYKLVPYRQI
jgi:hypothetical protein